MNIDMGVAAGSAVVGLLVGLTGAGGGALMTPMLVLLFGVTPSTAISSDLVAAVVMRPIGALVHLRRRTVNLALVGWLALGAVPSAFAGAYLLHVIGGGRQAQTSVELLLGAALLAGVGVMGVRSVVRRHRGEGLAGAAVGTAGNSITSGSSRPLPVAVRPRPTVGIGVLGGVVVGLTSVGSGSLVVVLLLCLYPAIRPAELIGTDLVQAIPLTAAAGLGQLVFGHVELGLTASLVVGGMPGVFVGSMLSSRAADRLLRPGIAVVLLASGLKYVGLGTTALEVVVAGLLGIAAAAWPVSRVIRRARSGEYSA